jgi:hypothetical protein
MAARKGEKSEQSSCKFNRRRKKEKEKTTIKDTNVFVRAPISRKCVVLSVKRLTSSIKLSPSSEANSYLATQETPSIQRNTAVHHRVHKSPPLVPELHEAILNVYLSVITQLSKPR